MRYLEPAWGAAKRHSGGVGAAYLRAPRHSEIGLAHQLRRKLQSGWFSRICELGGAAFTPRATARIGQLMLQKGSWEGRQLLQRGWVETAISNAGMPKPDRTNDPAPASGLCWYTNYDGAWRESHAMPSPAPAQTSRRCW